LRPAIIVDEKAIQSEGMMTNRKSRLEWIEHLHSMPIPLLLSILIFLCLAPGRAEVAYWLIELNLQVSGTQLSDEENYAGVLPFTTDDYDPGIDQCPAYPPQVPFPDPHLYFPHPEYDLLGENISGRCDYDLRAAFTQKIEWAMVIDTTLPSAEFVLEWNMGIPGNSVPSEYRVELLNAQRTKVADLWQASEYRYFTAATPQSATYYLVVTNDPPPSVQNFKAVQRIYGVQLTWNPVQVPDLAGYVIRYGTQSGEYPFLAQVGKNNTMTEIMGLNEDRDYFFRITAIDRTGLEGPLSLTTGHPCIPEAHYGDVDCSGLIDYRDLLFLAHEWQTVETTATLDFDNDFDHDDLLLFLSLWHETP